MTICEETTELVPVTASKLAPAELFVPNGLDAVIEKIRAQAQTVSPDISTEKSRKAIASMARKVASSKVYLDDLGKTLVADLKAQSAIVDSERKRMRDALDSLRDETRKPLTDWENAEKQRIQEHEDALKQIVDIATQCTGSMGRAGLEGFAARIRSYGSRDWQEFTHRHKETSCNALFLIDGAIEDADRRDREMQELERLRMAEQERLRHEREDRIRQDAEQRARQEADREAAREREAAGRAQRESEERIRQAELATRKAEADAARAVEVERQRVADEQACIAAEDAKREANKRHRGKINRETAAALISIGLTEEHAKAVVSAIAKGEIPNLRIAY